MSIELCVLASGSMGNCAVVRTPGGVVLMDAGIGPRVAARRMSGTGISLDNLAAICLTHLDCDHFTPSWARTILRHGIRLFCHNTRIDELLEISADLERYVSRFDSDFEPLPGLRAKPIALAHDELGSHGFVLEGFGCRMGYANDLGHVPLELIERFAMLDLLALESNYDPQMQRDSGRPWFLKQRIMGGRGHLSNQQAFIAIREILDRTQLCGDPLPAHIVLLHRSLECNCPRVVRRLFCSDPRIAPRLTLAEQFQRSMWLSPAAFRPFAGKQLTWGWG